MSRLFFFLLFIAFAVFAKEPKFLLLGGPSGIGKSTTIRELEKLDPRFIYIKPFTTRALREKEVDKIHLELSQIKKLEADGDLLALNELYGNYYATPLTPILEAIDQGLFPVLDWPIIKLSEVRRRLPEEVVSIYLYTTDFEQLSDRLAQDGRDPEGKRLMAGMQELTAFSQGFYEESIDASFNVLGKTPLEVAHEVYQAYLEKLD